MSYRTVPDFARANLWQALLFRYGEERARAIMLDQDPQANADLQKWRRLGSKREGAA
jgi:hypothetical protein